jgi:predicted DNA-binding transcriptional regulator YafY
MRADRLVSLVLLLQARGRTTALALAAELEVSVRTIYRDLGVLSAAGVPVFAESGPGATLVHLDMPRWFRSHEPVPHLRSVAEALRRQRQLALGYRRGDDGPDPVPHRIVGPLGLVNKAGTWYLVAMPPSGRPVVFRAGRITSARMLGGSVERPAGFELARFWDRWSQEFAASRPRLRVRLRASPQALAAFPEIFGRDAQEALDAAPPPDEHGWRMVTLSFEHERAAAHRLAGFGGTVEVLSPSSVRGHLLTTAQGIADCYR